MVTSPGAHMLGEQISYFLFEIQTRELPAQEAIGYKGKAPHN